MLKSLLALFLLLANLGYAKEPMEGHAAQTVIVTCASGEMGGAIAKKLAKKNNLILTGRDVQKLQKLQSDLQSLYPLKYEIAALDYCMPSTISSLANTLAVKKEEISGLVLLTPRPQFCQSLLDNSEENWINLLQTTFTGPLEVLKKTISHMTSESKIVVIAGTTSVQLQPEYGPACIIRRMWTTCVKALAHQIGQEGIYINALSPGVVLTDFHRKRIMRQAEQNYVTYEKQMKQDAAKIPLGRHAKPKEIANIAKFLLSKDSDFINGVNLVIDGAGTLSY